MPWLRLLRVLACSPHKTRLVKNVFIGRSESSRLLMDLVSLCGAVGPFLFFEDGFFREGLLGSGSVWRQEAEKAPDATLMFINLKRHN
jgi:hypothetical protein